MKTSGTVLLVDDEKGFRENVAERLERRGFNVLHAEEAESALSRIEDSVVDAAVVDILMPGMDGLTLLVKLKEIDPLMEVVMVTGQGSIESAVEAMHRGAFHYVTKPVRLNEVEMVLRRAIEKTNLARQNQNYREDIRRRQAQSASQIIASSSAMRRIIEETERLAQIDATVLIEGETGTGKEVVAEWIHHNSPRKDLVFSTLNCGALAENLVDAELFGYEKGSFTGAGETRPGIFEVTDGGTLLLDEIGDIALNAQVRLLRVLERGLLRRVGSTRELSVDVRVVASTNRQLDREVGEGRFREDLYHRINVFQLRIPPLRERPDDIIPLAEHFLSGLTLTGSSAKELGESARDALQTYPWPGNVRELAHTMERACFAAHLAGTDEISPEDLRRPLSADNGGMLVSLEEAQERHIKAVLARLDGNRKKAAEVLNVTERHLYRLLSRLGTQDQKHDSS